MPLGNGVGIRFITSEQSIQEAVPTQGLTTFTLTATPPLYGYVPFSVTVPDDPAITGVRIYAVPQTITQTKSSRNRVFKVQPGVNNIVWGDPVASVNILANQNGDFSLPGPPPNLAYGTTISGGTLTHVLSTRMAMTSPDGYVWTMQPTPTDPTIELKWQNHVWAGPPQNQFVAVSSDGQLDRQIMTSPDGINWTSRGPVSENMDLVAIGYSPTLNKFVAMGANASSTNRALSSTDGITWTPITSTVITSTLVWRDIAWGGLPTPVFVGVNQTNTATGVASSPDGITWTRRGSPAISGHGDWQCIIWTGPPMNLFVAGANNAVRRWRIMTSPDGITWTGRLTGFEPNFFPRGLAYSPELNLLVAVGASGTTRAVSTKDCIEWTDNTQNIDPPLLGSYLDVEWGNGMFVAVPGPMGSLINSQKSGAMISADGINWTAMWGGYNYPTGPQVQNWKSIVWSPQLNRWSAVAASEGGTFVDFNAWPEVTPNPVIGEVWRGCFTLSGFVNAPTPFDVTLRFMGGDTSEDIVVTSTVDGLKMGNRTITKPNRFPAIGMQPSVQGTVDDCVLFREVPGVTPPQGFYDYYAYPVNSQGDEGPGIAPITGVTII